MIGTCKNCGSQFPVQRKRGKRQRYCSEECWPRNKVIKLCPICDLPFFGMPRAVCCGITCGLTYIARRTTEKAVTNRKFKICEACGMPFVMRRESRKGDANRCCSRECGWALSRQAEFTPISLHPCDSCGKVFIARHGIKVCSERCRVERANGHNAKALAAYHSAKPALGIRKCDECGKEFTGERANGYFCSHRCSRRFYNRLRKTRTPSGREDIPRFWRIYDRANGRCEICGLPCDRLVSVPDPLAPTMDHIQPVVFRGPHVESNVQLTHFYCNTAKGALLVLSDGFREALKKEMLKTIAGARPNWKLAGIAMKIKVGAD